MAFEKRERRVRGRRDGVLGMPEPVAEAEVRYGRCPKGHPLPHETPKGQCTPLWCAGQFSHAEKTGTPRTRTGHLPKTGGNFTRVQKAPITNPTGKNGGTAGHAARLKGMLALQASDEKALDDKTQNALAKRARRQSLVAPPPKDLDGLDPVDYSKKKVASLSPEAVHDLEYDLKFGDDIARRAARDSILDANGLSKGDQRLGGIGPILIIGNTVPPWVDAKDITPKGLLDAQKPKGDSSGSKAQEAGADPD